MPEELTTSQLNQAPALVEPPPQPVQPQAQAAPQPPPEPANRIVLEITEASWVEIRNSEGAAILRQVLKPGDIYLVPDEKGLVMATGNAGGITVKVDGKPVAPLGPPAAVRRNIRLDPDILTQAGPRPQNP